MCTAKNKTNTCLSHSNHIICMHLNPLFTSKMAICVDHDQSVSQFPSQNDWYSRTLAEELSVEIVNR